MKPSLEKQGMPNDAGAVQAPAEATIPHTILPCAVAEPRLLNQLAEAAQRHGHTEGATKEFLIPKLRLGTLRCKLCLPRLVVYSLAWLGKRSFRDAVPKRSLGTRELLRTA